MGSTGENFVDIAGVTFNPSTDTIYTTTMTLNDLDLQQSLNQWCYVSPVQISTPNSEYYSYTLYTGVKAQTFYPFNETMTCTDTIMNYTVYY